MAMEGVVVSVTGNFDRQVLSSAVRKAGGRVDALVHKNLDYVSHRCTGAGVAQPAAAALRGPPCAHLARARRSRPRQVLTSPAVRQLISDDEAIKRNTQRVRKVVHSVQGRPRGGSARGPRVPSHLPARPRAPAPLRCWPLGRTSPILMRMRATCWLSRRSRWAYRSCRNTICSPGSRLAEKSGTSPT